MTVYTATLTRRRMFGLRSPLVIISEPCATAQGALIDLCAKYTNRFGGMMHTRYSDRLEVVGASA
jgi:hypothetical protein